MENNTAEKGIQTGALRRAYNDALSKKVLCRNQILIALASMKAKNYRTNEANTLLKIIEPYGYDKDYLRIVIPQVDEKYFPRRAQIDQLLEVIIEGNHTYEEGFIKDSLLKSVNIEDLTRKKAPVKRYKRPSAQQLKEYIFETDQIEFVLESIGCHSIELNWNGTEYRCGNYDGDRTDAIRVKNNPYLDVTNYTRPQYFDDKSDIINLVQYNRGCDFNGAMDYLCTLLELSNKDISSIDTNTVIQENLAKSKEKEVEKKSSIFKPRTEEELGLYVPILFIGWLREGIAPWTRDKFDIRYSYNEKSIIIPIRKWDDGTLLAFNKRTTIENAEELDIKKYHLDKGYPKSKNIYGLWENRTTIENKGYCVIFEGEKSVLKRDSLTDATGVAVQGSIISAEQVNILLSLNISEVIIAMDSDITRDHTRALAEKFYGKIKVSYMWDNTGLLGEKQSPADVKNADYQYLFDNRVVYDEVEHEKYLESLKKK